MIDILEQFSNINQTNLQLLHEYLVTDSTINSEYNSFCIIYMHRMVDENNKSSLFKLDVLLEHLNGTSAEESRTLIAAFEIAEPALFKRLYGDLVTYFYSTAETAARVRLLADSAPREPSPHFDPTLLDAVIANQSGKRRL